MELPKKITHKIVGKSIIAVIQEKKYSLMAEPEKKKELTELIRKYNIKPSKTAFEKLVKEFSPKTEKEKTEKLVAKKVKKQKIKKVTKELKEAKKEIKQIGDGDRTVDEEMAKLLKGDKRFLVKDGHLYLKPYTEVQMPKVLVKRLRDFLVVEKSERDPKHMDALINFWQLALLNPNPIARTKLFDYLTRQNITITPNGYFVTYRMVKKTDKEGVFTSAHTGKEEYRIGKAFKISRKECDEDGGKDCSKGLHTGTPQFIGIIAEKKVSYKEGETVGQGYGEGVKTVVTKAERSDSYGTGYDRPEQSTSQSFNNSFGNQAVITLVNPMHVVSIPNSDTRKLRACEIYFAKLTTPEEVIDMVEKDYLIYDTEYKQYEKEEILAMLKDSKLEEYIDNALGAKSIKKKKEAEAALAALKINIGQDEINKTGLSMPDILKIIKSRVK